MYSSLKKIYLFGGSDARDHALVEAVTYKKLRKYNIGKEDKNRLRRKEIRPHELPCSTPLPQI